ncbi:MAG: hypothetical protein HC905_26430 [Bacteroidales bacterium]|nr:hypothetical protein [Bacteroidales bacterium]
MKLTIPNTFLAGYDFSSPEPNHSPQIKYDSGTKNHYCQLDSNTSFSPAIKKKYTQLTNKDHVWIRAQVDIFIPRENTDEPPLLVMTFSRREGLYGYNAIALPQDSIRKGEWLKLNYDYLTPDIRSAKDEFQCYMWYRGKKPVFIDNLKADVFVPK